jgi:nucleoside 2-deoxyribosyltransferase
MAFYKQFKELEEVLKGHGHEVLAPELEFETVNEDTSVGYFFERNGGLEAFPLDHEVWKKKGRAIESHFRKIDASECILVVNHEKKGVANYIGGNTFLEIGYAFATGKKIFILNELPDTSAYMEELRGMQPIVLSSDLTRIA